jgi:phenylalanine-4-hydroxylase
MRQRRLATSDLVKLDREHPGFRDPEYRARRNAIARVATDYAGGPVPDVVYSEDEHGVWRLVRDRLDPLHRRCAAKLLVDAADRVALPVDRIPQLGEVNRALEAATGFAMRPVAGLVAARAFLAELGSGTFLSTQYMRHPSAPFYTPEPDVVHELVGHAASLTDPRIAGLSRAMGLAAQTADDAGLLALERVYWYTLEFGAVLEDDRPKAFGAGLLSSVGEIQRLSGAELLPWDLSTIAATAYDPTDYQPRYFLAPSTTRLLDDLSAWVEARFGVSV